MENVKGMLNKIDEILKDISDILGSAYSVHYKVFNARDFGVPQNRERLIVIGNRLGISSVQIIEDIEARCSHLPRFTLLDAISDLPELKPNHRKNSTYFESNDIGFFEIVYTYKKTPFYLFINGDKELKFLYNHKGQIRCILAYRILCRTNQETISLKTNILN